MKQIAIFCSPDLADRVVAALDHAGIEGFLRLGEATGNKFRDRGEVPRTMTWEATAFIVPGAGDAAAAAVVEALESYAGACDIRPCLRIVVSPVEQIY